MNSIITNQNLIKPESSYVVRHRSVVIDTIRSRAFCFGEIMKRIRKLKRKKNANYCECGCGQEVSTGKRFIYGHNRYGEHFSAEHRKKLSIAASNRSEEHRNKQAISHMKCRTDGYCDAWSDRNYKSDCRGNYCEICGIEKEITIVIYWRKNNRKVIMKKSNLVLHHIDFDKKNCSPDNFQTLCGSCHTTLHNKLKIEMRKP